MYLYTCSEMNRAPSRINKSKFSILFRNYTYGIHSNHQNYSVNPLPLPHCGDCTNGAVTHLKITEHNFYELNNKNALTSVTF